MASPATNPAPVVGSARTPLPTALIGDLVTAVDHVGVAVHDLDATKAWYANHLGFVCLHEETNHDQGIHEAMIGPPEAGRSGAAQIQLMAPIDDTSTIAKFLDRRGPGLQQLAVRVTDVDEVVRRLREHDVRVLYPEARRGTAGSRINFIHPKDAGGVLIELVEPAVS